MDEAEEVDTREEDLRVVPEDEDAVIDIAAPSKSYFFGMSGPPGGGGDDDDPIVENMKDQMRSHKRKRFRDSDSDSDFKSGDESDGEVGEWEIPSNGSGLIAAKQRHEQKRKAPPTKKPKPTSLAEEINNLAGVVRDSPPAYIPGDANANGEIPAPPDIFDWTDINEAEPEINPISEDWCVLCKVTQRTIDINPENTYYKDLMDYARLNWSKVSAETMGTELQTQYNDGLRPYIQPEEFQLPCRKYIFWLHFVDHCSDPLINAEVNSKITQEMINVINKRQLFVLDPLTKAKKVTGNPKIPAMLFKLFDRQDKFTKQILSLRPSSVL